MKFQLSITFWLLGAALALPTARGENPPPMSAAVLDFQTIGDALKGEGAEVAALLNARLSRAVPGVVLVERQEIEKIFSEQELGLSGTVTPDTAAKVGSLTGAKALITGRLFDMESKFCLAAKIVSTETGRVYGESVTFGSLANLDEAVDEITDKVSADLVQHADTLLAKVETPAERLERLRKKVEGKNPLPSVSIVIAEQQINRAVIDPAAQTEIAFVLQQLGFEVLDPKTTGRRADVEIVGEAFSELAGRRGNLISSRARIEARVTKTADGRLLLADRQTDVAVDLAEQTAGKLALESAANRLLDRIVPKLVVN